MSHDIEIARSPDLALAREVERAKAYIDARISENTRAAYEEDWARFEEWCLMRGGEPVGAPDAVVSVHLSWLADEGHSAPAIRRAYAAIAWMQHEKGAPGWPAPARGQRRQPECAKVLSGILRTHLHRARGKKAITVEMLPKLLPVGDDLLAIRNRAVILVDFALALRRAGLATIDVEHLQDEEWGIRVYLPRSKIDQEGRGDAAALFFAERDARLCPVSALRSWLDAAGIESGSVFRSFGIDGTLTDRRIHPRLVARVVKDAVERAGLGDPRDYGAHSLRAGFITSARLKGADGISIARQTKQSLQTIVGYDRADVHLDNAAKGLLMTSRRSRVTDEEVAVHEAAHAVVIMAAGGTVSVASIVPQRGSQGRVECPHDGLLALRYLCDGDRVAPEILRQLASDEIRAHLAGRAAEELFTGESHFNADAHWLDDVADRDPDVAGAVECGLLVDRRDVVRRIAREYDLTLEFLDANWAYVEVLADALLEHGTICPQWVLPELLPLGDRVRERT